MAISNIKSKVDKLKGEVVVGGSFSWYKKDFTLPIPLDDLSAQYGIDIYTKMMMDSQVSACITVYKTSVIEEGITLSSPITDPDEDGYDLAREILNIANDMFNNLAVPLDDVLYDMMDAVVYGNRVAEQIYVSDGDKLLLAALKVKPIERTAYVVDKYLNVLGLVADSGLDGQLSSAFIDPEQVLPRHKFFILTHKPKNSDPRGTSMLRPAYESYWWKRQILPEYMKFLVQFAGPSLVGYTSEEADSVLDETGKVISAEQNLLKNLIAFKNGSALALPYGAKLDFVRSEGEGVAFTNAIGAQNLAITKAILTQELATEESQYMARAAATVHQDVLDTLVRQGKRSVIKTFIKDVLRPWVIYNWGYEAIKLTPMANLGVIEHRDKAPLMNAIANLMRSSFFTDDQLVEIDKLLSLPVRKSNKKSEVV